MGSLIPVEDVEGGNALGLHAVNVVLAAAALVVAVVHDLLDVLVGEARVFVVTRIQFQKLILLITLRDAIVAEVVDDGLEVAAAYKGLPSCEELKRVS